MLTATTHLSYNEQRQTARMAQYTMVVLIMAAALALVVEAAVPVAAAAAKRKAADAQAQAPPGLQAAGPEPEPEPEHRPEPEPEHRLEPEPERMDVNDVDDDGGTPLMAAALHGQLGVLRGEEEIGVQRAHLNPWASSYAPPHRVYGAF